MRQTKAKKETCVDARLRVLGDADHYLDDIDAVLLEEEVRVGERAETGAKEHKEQEHDAPPAKVNRRAERSLAMPKKVREELASKERPIETK